MGVDGVAGVACRVSENQFGEVEQHSLMVQLRGCKFNAHFPVQLILVK